MTNLNRNEFVNCRGEGLNEIRAFHLENGTVFTVGSNNFSSMLMFEDELLYKVDYKGYNDSGPVYEKTGVSYTMEELNKLMKS